MIQNHKLLIDKHCPMCVGYSKVFTSLHMLERDGIAPYQNIEDEHTQHIDMHRAQNEIALYNTATKETTYGLDAMIHIVTQGNRFFKAIFQAPLIYWPLKMLYKLITYNRKVIVGGVSYHSGERSCNPDHNSFFRSLFIVLTALVTGLVLNAYFKQVSALLGYETPWYVEYIICFGQVLWQGVFMTIHAPTKRWDYLGNMSAVSMMGALLLMPLVLLNSMIGLPVYALPSYFILVVTIMLLDHLRRSKSLQIGLLPTVSWVAYRSVVLIMLITLFVL